jgi:phage terminase large subunit-like protein
VVASQAVNEEVDGGCDLASSALQVCEAALEVTLPLNKRARNCRAIHHVVIYEFGGLRHPLPPGAAS